MTNMKKIYCIFIIINLSILLISCSNKTEKVDSPPEPVIQSPIVFEHNDQEFKIFTYYQEFIDFLESAKKEPNNLEELYKQSVLEALRQNGLGYEILNDWMFTTPSDIEALEESIKKLINKQNLLNESIKEALSKSSDQLPGGDKSIYVLPAIPEFSSIMEDMNYSTGSVWNKNSMLILIDSSFLEENLKHTVAHEYHHTVYMETNNTYWYNLLEQSITEGKADTFAKVIYPDVDIPWIKPLSGQIKKEVWKIFTENLHSTDSELGIDFVEGNDWKGIPRWSKYKIGDKIMESFLERNPEVSIEEWTKMPSEDILAKSEYKVE